MRRYVSKSVELLTDFEMESDVFKIQQNSYAKLVYTF